MITMMTVKKVRMRLDLTPVVIVRFADGSFVEFATDETGQLSSEVFGDVEYTPGALHEATQRIGEIYSLARTKREITATKKFDCLPESAMIGA
jgi:hypothetical protein